MYNWNGTYESNNHKYLGLILFATSASIAVILFICIGPYAPLLLVLARLKSLSTETNAIKIEESKFLADFQGWKFDLEPGSLFRFGYHLDPTLKPIHGFFDYVQT